ncbi:MAG: LysR substrate-binding domain-containing protein [Casimicrobiaceae bacterium]|nr:LysR substrate-binding domain-containing protein [Casimicrobiaceae bacterium]MCX8097801.1 LysR substrate-binding domain-containing protein [Casimicrobiaceae bacterium]MDW8312651.1 LysR substrate-binding domain-containing protein [Burkholderiales bacterium]
MSSLPPFGLLVAFEAVARRGSFLLAAKELSLSPSAVSHRLARLEALLGARLLDRNAHGIRLTALGRHYLMRLSAPLSALRAATDDIKRGSASTLHVHSAPSIAILWLMPRLPSFARAHPEVSLSLSASHSHSDFALGEADVDIRYGVPNWPGLHVEPLFREPILPLASPAFVRTHRLRTARQLRGLPLIQSTVNVVQWSDWFAAYESIPPPERFALRFDRAQIAMEAAIHGLGVALESAVLAEEHLRKRRLVAPFGAEKAVWVEAHFLVYPAAHAERPAVARFLQWLRREANLTPLRSA